LSEAVLRPIGPQPFRPTKIAPLDAVRRAEALREERDLRQVPTPVSGGMRKALHKEMAQQQSLRPAARRRPYGAADGQRAYGLMVTPCPSWWCRQTMYFDEVDLDDHPLCDRCRRPLW